MAGFAPPTYRWLNNGAVAAGGLMYVYVTNSTTLANIFTSNTLGTPAANPLTLDANGEAVFYTDGTQLLRLDGYTAAGGLIKSIDPVFPLPDLHTFTGTGTDLQKIVGITNGTALANKALVTDASINVSGLFTNVYGVANTSIANMNTVIGSQSGGGINKFRNAAFDVMQRPPSGTVNSGTSAYTADGWIVTAAGANSPWTWTKLGTLGLKGELQSYLQLNSAVGLTGLSVKQRIESIPSNQLAGNTVTVQWLINHNLAAAFTPKLTMKHATADDNWGATTTDLSSQSLQSVPPGTPTLVYYTYSCPTGAGHGIEATLDFEGNFNVAGKTVNISRASISITPGFINGASNSLPPLIELKSYAEELAWCQRYLAGFGDIIGVLGQGWASSTSLSGFIIPLKTPMRILPTGLTITTVGNLEIATFAGADVAALTGLTFNATYSSNMAVHAAATVAGTPLTAATAYMLEAKTALAGNLIITGAEL